ncbi:unnamed protein product [Porites lobata]|uniref:Uncharacterized protein n=1 Tax=Porites lobata TaxID=104759 RepID=A0ABN8RVM9_9CNID|nr:unnamed protein product [Porites lobata]
MTFQIPEKKVCKLKRLLNSAIQNKSSSYRELARIAGSIISEALAVGPISHARAPSTVLKYKSGWLRWREWALSKIGVPVIPAKPLHIAFFISELAKRSSENNIGVSSTESAVYAIKGGHAMAGFEACPVSHPLVKFALEGAKRRLARPVQPKEPLSVSTVQAMATHFASSGMLHFPIFVFYLFFWLVLQAFFALMRLGI